MWNNVEHQPFVDDFPGNHGFSRTVNVYPLRALRAPDDWMIPEKTAGEIGHFSGQLSLVKSNSAALSTTTSASLKSSCFSRRWMVKTDVETTAVRTPRMVKTCIKTLERWGKNNWNVKRLQTDVSDGRCSSDFTWNCGFFSGVKIEDPWADFIL